MLTLLDTVEAALVILFEEAVVEILDITVPLAWISLAVISVIVSISFTFAALIKISSGSDFISNKLPNDCVPCFGTIKTDDNLGDSSVIIYALSSWK